MDYDITFIFAKPIPDDSQKEYPFMSDKDFLYFSLGKFVENSLRVEVEKEIVWDEDRIFSHYWEHVEKPFFPKVVKMLDGKSTKSYILKGINAIEKTRKIIGSYSEPEERTLRWEYERNFEPVPSHNGWHAADSKGAVLMDISLHFEEEEIMNNNLYSKLREYSDGLDENVKQNLFGRRPLAKRLFE